MTISTNLNPGEVVICRLAHTSTAPTYLRDKVIPYLDGPGGEAFDTTFVCRRNYQEPSTYTIVAAPGYYLHHNARVRCAADVMLTTVQHNYKLGEAFASLARNQLCTDNDSTGLLAFLQGENDALACAVRSRAEAHDKDKAAAAAGLYRLAAIAANATPHGWLSAWIEACIDSPTFYFSRNVRGDRDRRISPHWACEVLPISSFNLHRRCLASAMIEHAATFEMHDLRQSHHLASWVTNSNALHIASFIEHLCDSSTFSDANTIDFDFHRSGKVWVRDNLERWHNPRNLVARLPAVQAKYYAYLDAFGQVVADYNEYAGECFVAKQARLSSASSKKEVGNV